MDKAEQVYDKHFKKTNPYSAFNFNTNVIYADVLSKFFYGAEADHRPEP